MSNERVGQVLEQPSHAVLANNKALGMLGGACNNSHPPGTKLVTEVCHWKMCW